MISMLPLSGRRILVTRARHQAGKLSAELAAMGAEVIEIPAIEILPPMSREALDDALHNLHKYQWLIITSANAVHAIRDRLAALNLHRAGFSHLKIAAVGSATASSLNEVGLAASIVPEEYVAESLIAAIGDQARDQQVLIARAAVARDVIPQALAEHGAHIDVVDAYQTVIPESSIRRVAEVLGPSQPPPDAATFTSSSTVTNFLHLLEAAGVERPERLLAISIGPITSRTLRDHRWEPAAEADPHDIPGLIAATVRALYPGP